MISQRNERRTRKTENDNYIRVRLSTEKKRKLQQIAKAEYRTVSAVIMQLIDERIADSECKQNKPE